MRRSFESVVVAILFAAVGLIAAAPASQPRTVVLSVTKEGFVPAEVKVRKGEPLKLVITRTVERTCATEIVLAGTGIRRDLPLNQPVEITLTPDKAGTMKYACAMGMVGGVLLVE